MATGAESDDDPVGDQRPAHMERRRWAREPATGKERPPHASPALVPLRFSTQDLPPTEQFPAWRAHMAPLVDVHLPEGKSPEDGFLAEQIGWHLGDISSSSSARMPTDMSAIRPCFDRAPSTIGTSA